MIAPRLATLLLCGSTLAAPVAAEVLDSSASGFTVQNVVTVSASPDRAWRALVKDVDAWWPKDHSWFGKDGRFTIDARAGGCFCEIAGKRQAVNGRRLQHKARMILFLLPAVKGKTRFSTPCRDFGYCRQ